MLIDYRYAGCVAGCDELLAESLQINHSGEFISSTHYPYLA